MKRVLLLNPPYARPLMRDTFHPTAKSTLYLWHPLDLLIQSGYLRGFDVRLFDGVVDRRNGALDELLRDFRPDAVLSLVSFPSLEADMALLRRIKTEQHAVVFAVGDITYGEKEAFLERHPFVDGILPDYTSKAFAQFLRGETIRNGIWRDDGAIRSNADHEPIDYDTPRHDLLDLTRYYLPYWEPPFASAYTSHGCPAKCIFCVAPGWGAPRFREHDRVLDELESLRGLGVRKVFFRDGSFNQWARNTVSLCEKIAARFPDHFRFTTWFKPKPLSDEMAAAMKAAGFQYVHLGCETGSPDFLRRLGKDFAVEDVEPAVAMLHRHGIKVVGHFMLGLPGQTEYDNQLTARFLKKTRLDVISFSVFEYSYGIKIKKEPDGPVVADDRSIKRQLLSLYSTFYLRPRRWPRIWFFENWHHFLRFVPRALKYLFELRLYPKFKALE